MRIFGKSLDWWRGRCLDPEPEQIPGQEPIAWFLMDIRYHRRAAELLAHAHAVVRGEEESYFTSGNSCSAEFHSDRVHIELHASGDPELIWDFPTEAVVAALEKWAETLREWGL